MIFFCKESLRGHGENNEDKENSCCSDSDSNSESGNETSSESSDLYVESDSSDSNVEDAEAGSDEDDKPLFQDPRLTYREHLLSANSVRYLNTIQTFLKRPIYWNS